MRILMTNHALDAPGGTETWTETMATELVDRGHEVEIFTLRKGRMSDRMPCPVRDRLPYDNYDLFLVNHNPCLGLVSRKSGPKVFTSHGPTHGLERPVSGADLYVAVSEEVRDTNPEMFTTVIRQPIDMRKFRPAPALPIDRGVLVMTKNIDAAHLAMAACKRAGLTAEMIHYQDRPIFETWEFIATSGLVISSGRGILEALACGRPAYCLNHFQGRFFGDGWVTEEKLLAMQRKNYSGRATDRDLGDADLIAQELDTGWAKMASEWSPAWGPAWIEQHHDVRDICDQYMALGMAGTMKPQSQEAAP